MQKLKNKLKDKLMPFRHRPIKVVASCGLVYEDYSPLKKSKRK